MNLGGVRPDKVKCRWRPAALLINGWGKHRRPHALTQTASRRKKGAENPDLSSKAWTLATEEIKAKIEARIRNVPEQNRERAFINAAKTEALNQTVKSPRIHP